MPTVEEDCQGRQMRIEFTHTLHKPEGALCLSQTRKSSW